MNLVKRKKKKDKQTNTERDENTEIFFHENKALLVLETSLLIVHKLVGLASSRAGWQRKGPMCYTGILSWVRTRSEYFYS